VGDFSPLAPPQEIHVGFEELTAASLDRMQAEFTVLLKEGSYRLPLFKTDDLPVEIPPGCQCRVQASAGQLATGASSQTVLLSGDVTFEPPLALGNIFTVLTGLQSYFSDNDVAAIVAWITETVKATTPVLSSFSFLGNTFAGALVRELKGRLKEQTEWTPLVGNVAAAVSRSAREAASVRLGRVTARPVRHDQEWRLELRFTGEWQLFGQYRIPFHQVRVHPTILPAPHAALDLLLSDEPLATARIKRGPLPTLPLAQAAMAMVSSFKGETVLKGIPPDVGLEWLMADDGVAGIELRDFPLAEFRSAVSGEVRAEEISFRLERAELASGGSRLECDGWAKASALAPPAGDASKTAAGLWLAAIKDREWSSKKLRASFHAAVRPGSTLPPLSVSASHRHPLVKGEAALSMKVREIAVSGEAAAAFGLQAAAEEAEPPKVDLAFLSSADLLPGSRFEDGKNVVLPEGRATGLELRIRSAGRDRFEIETRLRAEGRLTAGSRTEPFPEINLDGGELKTSLAGAIELDGRLVTREEGRKPLVADFSGTQAALRLDEAKLALEGRRLTVPVGTTLQVRMTEAILAASGLGRADLEVRWNMQGESPRLAGPKRKGKGVELFVPELRRGMLTLHVSPAGGITVSGPGQGLYDGHFFNALVNPGDEIPKIVELLSSEEALHHVFAAAAELSPDAADLLQAVRRLARRCKTALNEEGIREPKDFIPGPAMAQVLAKILFGKASLAARVYPIVKQVTDGEGLNVAALKKLLADVHPDHEYEFEVGRALRLGTRLLGPGAPPPPVRLKKALPLTETPEYLERFAGLPSAAQLYRIVEARGPFPDGFSALTARLAPYLTSEQVSYLIDRGRQDWNPEDLARLKHVGELKTRVRMFSQGYGGVGYAPQAAAIHFFLGETIRLSKAAATPDDGRELLPYEIAGCLLGPEDVAALLQAGLASAWAGRAVQLNQRLLLDLVFEAPGAFVRDVLVELGGNDPRVLTAALMALLDMPQDKVRAPLDLPALLTERLGLEVPRLADYMAGGRKAKHSYYEHLSLLAHKILSGAELYRALKLHVQECRRPPCPGYRATSRKERLAEDAQHAIAEADRLGMEGARAYEQAFTACRRLLAADPHAFQLPWFKRFWGRNQEALVVRSVVRNVQEQIDDVPRWLEVRSGRPQPAGEQELVETVIEALYYFEKDRRELRRDPLVRLLLPPPEGRYDFTVVSCMGVITAGAKGSELAEAYRRLEERYGIKVTRADTATARSLDYNASRIIDAARASTTPWGYVGYSQGCANGLMAESKLFGGTPSQQELLDGLVCRNLLFSAFNGSAHGTCGDQKFLDAMVFLDGFLAHYQSVLSAKAVQLALQSIRMALDSRAMVLGLLGTRSLSIWGVMALHRGGQFKGTAPTSSVRGIVEPDTLPEGLEFLSNVLAKQVGTERHDTQVTVEEAVGHSLHIRNPWAEVLERCDMGCKVQRTHHWSPLKEDTRFVTTQRDVERAIYEFPKDRHVFPWVEVNARFGLIRSDGARRQRENSGVR
jgi:hypothetical protein